MKPKIQVHIPQPCHENWNNMSPVDKGRFCQSCNKQVIDFSIMTDNEIINHLTRSTGRTCGRFAETQLQRNLQPTIINKKQSWWIALTMPLLLLFDKANAQKKVHNKSKGNVSYTKKEVLTVGDVLIKPEVNKSFRDTITLSISPVKHETFETPVLLNKEINEPIINTNLLQSQSLGEVVFAGGLSICYRIKKIDTIQTFIRKAFHQEAFKVFPNPAKRGAQIKIDVKKAGEYSIQLIDVKSNFIAAIPFDAVTGSTIANFAMPSNIALGVYYIIVRNEQTKKQYSDKILIQ